MLRKIKYSTLVIALLSLLTFLNSGCGNAVKEVAQTKIETQATQSLPVPQDELIETPKYKELKRQVEKTHNKVNELEFQKSAMLVKYTEKHSSVKEISNKLKESKKVLDELEILLAEETEKLKKRPKNPAV
jgi:peptidoglycan hydrolase CwlO-like protein